MPKGQFLIGLAIGASVQGSFGQAFGGARKSLDTLGRQVNDLSAKHQKAGKEMQRAMRSLSDQSIAPLAREYEALGQQVDALRAKHERLNTVMAKSDALKTRRSEILGSMRKTAMMGAAIGAPVVKSVMQAATYETQLRDEALIGRMTPEQERQFGLSARAAALGTGQTQEAMLGGMGKLKREGMDVGLAMQYGVILGKAATAANADTESMAVMTHAFGKHLGIEGEEATKEALSRAIHAGKLGRFETKDMGKLLPDLMEQFKGRGMGGLTEILSALEASRERAESDEAAVMGMRRWIEGIAKGSMAKQFEDAGHDFTKSMTNLTGAGWSQYEASLAVAMDVIDSKGEKFAAELKKVGASGDEEAQRQLLERVGLAEVFTNRQALNHLIAMRDNWDKYQSNKTELGTDTAKGALDEDYARRMDTMEKSWQTLRTTGAELGISIGSALTPALTDLINLVTPAVEWVANFARENPKLTETVVTLGAGLVGARMAMLGVSLALTTAKIAMLGFNGAALANPLGLLITGLILGAYLIYKNWDAIKNAVIGGVEWIGGALSRFGQWLGGFFGGAWAEVKTAFSGGIGGVGALILNWSPLGLFYRAFAGVLSWFGIDLPAKFTDFGSALIDGLIGGIKAKWTAVKESITSIGAGVAETFQATLGIHSPSLVFAGFGDNIAEGMALGIDRSAADAAGAASRLARRAADAVKGMESGPALAGAPAGGGSLTVQFSPTVHVTGGGPGVAGEVKAALGLTLDELEGMVKRLCENERRRSY